MSWFNSTHPIAHTADAAREVGAGETAPAKPDDLPGVKRCGKCGAHHPVTLFNKNLTSLDGRQHYCRPCMGAYQKNHDAEKKIQHSAWRAKFMERQPCR